MKLYETLSQDLNFNMLFSQHGHLTLAHSDRSVNTMMERAEVNRLLGVDSRVIYPDEIKELDARLAEIEEQLRTFELGLPNVPHSSVPIGTDESANRVERTWGDKPKFDFQPKSHWDIGEALGVSKQAVHKKHAPRMRED